MSVMKDRLRGLGDEVETVGVAPVPDGERTMKPGRMFIVWLMASASATTPLIGNLLKPYGLWYMIGAILVAFAIGAIPAGLFSEMGRETPVTALIVARKTYGWFGSFVFSVVFTVVNLGWFGLNTSVGAEILAGVTHSSQVLWDWVVGGIQIILVIFGMKWLERFYRYTTAVLIICYAALVVYLITHYTLHTPKQIAPMQWGAALTTVLSFSLLAWTYKISTVSRFAVPAGRAKGPSYFMAASTGIMLAVLVMGVAGIYSDQATGDWNIALLGAHISGWGFVAALGVALAVIHTNAMNLYPSTVDLLVALNTLRKPRAWEQPVATVILGIGGILLAWAGILSKVQTFLDDAGNVIISFTFVMLADWLFFQRRRDSAGSFYEKPGTVSGWISWQAVVSFAVGVVIAFQGQHFLPSFCYETLPLSVLAGLVAAALDVLLNLPRGRTWQSR